MSGIDAAYDVLRRASEPLHHRETTRRALDQGLWHSNGATAGRVWPKLPLVLVDNTTSARSHPES